VFAGALVIIVFTRAVDILLHATDTHPPTGQPINDGLALVATSYSAIIGVGGARLTARLAPTMPMRHAIVLGSVVLPWGLWVLWQLGTSHWGQRGIPS
jgi:hypothetical protein